MKGGSDIASVLVITHRDLIGEGLRNVIGNCRELRLIGIRPTVEEAIKMPHCPAPQLIIYDGASRQWSDLTQVASLGRHWPSARVLILVSEYSEATQAVLLRCGLPHWRPDDICASALADELQRLSRGGTFVSLPEDPPMTWKLGNGWRQFFTLTAREMDVLELVSKGYSNKEIGHRLGMSELTVKTHLKPIYSKLQVSNRVEATLVWRSAGRHAAGEG